LGDRTTRLAGCEEQKQDSQRDEAFRLGSDGRRQRDEKHGDERPDYGGGLR
jgi:hypothetical protein